MARSATSILVATALGAAVVLCGAVPASAGLVEDWNHCAAQVLPKIHGRIGPGITNADQQYCVALAYDFGRGGLPQNRAEAIRWLSRAVQQGHAGAMATLGYHYEKGYGVRADLRRAAALYTKSADAGNSDGMFSLARLLYDGRGVAKDTARAKALLHRAAKLGNADAAHMLAQLPVEHQAGDDLFAKGAALYRQKKYADAATLFLEAAKQGHARAQLQIGWQYEYGKGVAQDNRQAAFWYAKAAAQNVATAEADLGLLYEEGRGVAESWRTAAQLYRKAAAQGDDLGLFRLGRAYQFGIGVPMDRDEAIKIFRQAGARGNAKANYFARWLVGSGNCIGYRNQVELDRFGGICEEPTGVTFSGSAQRNAWLQVVYQKVEASRAAMAAARSASCRSTYTRSRAQTYCENGNTEAAKKAETE